MNWLATLRRSGGVHALSRQMGVSLADVMAGTDALLPELLGHMRDFVDRGGGGQIGAKALVNLLAGLGAGNLAAEGMGPNPIDTRNGDLLLGHLFGDPGRIAQATRVAAEAGEVDALLLSRIHAPLAMLIGGYIAARAAGSGAEGTGGLGSVVELLKSDAADRRDPAGTSSRREAN